MQGDGALIKINFFGDSEVNTSRVLERYSSGVYFH
jgi:hypothetical protein